MRTDSHPAGQTIPLLISDAARALAVCIGAFGFLNAISFLVFRNFRGNLWWIDLRPLPAGLAETITLLLSAALIAGSFVHTRNQLWRRLWRFTLVLFLSAALLNSAGYYILLSSRLRGMPVPFSLLLAGLFLFIILATWKPATGSCPRLIRFINVIAAVMAIAAFFPLAQMICFGRTDYRRPADVIVVFGARAYADGRPSDALADRVRTGCELYQQGLAKTIVFSGGPGDGAIHETQAMRAMALKLGVHDDDIRIDPAGVNTAATVENTEAMFDQLGAQRVLAVSHAYHLPRVKLTYQQAGRKVFTVPAEERYVLTKMPLLMVREVAALWLYYGRGLLGQPYPAEMKTSAVRP